METKDAGMDSCNRIELGKASGCSVIPSRPEDDKRKINENIFGELDMDVLNSENGMSVLFESLNRYLLEDELMNSWNKFEDFEKYERKHGEIVCC